MRRRDIGSDTLIAACIVITAVVVYSLVAFMLDKHRPVEKQNPAPQYCLDTNYVVHSSDYCPLHMGYANAAEEMCLRHEIKKNGNNIDSLRSCFRMCKYCMPETISNVEVYWTESENLHNKVLE